MCWVPSLQSVGSSPAVCWTLPCSVLGPSLQCVGSIPAVCWVHRCSVLGPSLQCPILIAGFPKIIHQTWKTEHIPKQWVSAVESCKGLNPDYEYRLWTDAQLADLVRNDYPWLLPTFQGQCRWIQGQCHWIQGQCHWIQGQCRWVQGQCRWFQVLSTFCLTHLCR